MEVYDGWNVKELAARIAATLSDKLSESYRQQARAALEEQSRPFLIATWKEIVEQKEAKKGRHDNP